MRDKKPSEVSTALSLSRSFDSQTSTCSNKPQPSNASASSSNRKRRSESEKKVCHNNIPKKSKGPCSTILNDYEGPWKIKKTLKQSDLGDMSRLLLATNLVEDLVLPVMGVDAKDPILTKEGIPIEFWDVNTMSPHKLILKRWSSSKSYVFIGSWNQDFVKRRNLKKGDEIGLEWDSNKSRFDFAVLYRDFFETS